MSSCRQRAHIAFAVAVAFAATLAFFSGTARASLSGAPEGRVANDELSFLTLCGFSHRNTDDPIVLPRRPGVSHDHTFVGNVSTDAFSTVATLLRARTTCDRKSDTAAYWAPTLYVDNRPVDPTGAVVYYRRLTDAQVRPYPKGLTMVAGDSHAGAAQSLRVVYWDCGVVKTTLYGPIARGRPVTTSPAASSVPPSCAPGSKLQLHVNFPDCWNGKTRDSVDHKRHMAYSRNGRCAASHPIAVPELTLVYQYPVEPGVIALSSGSVYTAHADFINAWDEKALRSLVDRCLNERRPCGTSS